MVDQPETPRRRDSWPWELKGKPYNIIITILVAINISLILVDIGIWVMAAVQNLFVTADFTSFYTAYYLVRTGQGADIYNAAVQASYQLKFMGGSITFAGGFLLFPNPPFVAILFSPISLLPLHAAFYLWTTIQLGLLAWALWTIAHIFSAWSQKERMVLLTAILAFWPLINDLLLGQFSLLLLTGILQIYLGMKNSRPIQAGLGFLLLAIKPQSVLLPGMMTLNKRHWRSALVAGTGGLVLFIFSLAMLGIQPWIQYAGSVKSLSSYLGEHGVYPQIEYTVRGIAANILGNTQAALVNTIGIVFLLAGMILVWILWRRKLSPAHRQFDLYFALTIALSVFLSMHLNPHDALLLVFPAALFYDYLRQNNYPRKVYSIIVLLGPAVFFIAAFSGYNLFNLIRPPIILILILLAWMIRYVVLVQHEVNSDSTSLITPTKSI